MKIELYNSLGKKKEEFKSIEKNKVGLYTCGPTVYDAPHIGNILAYIYWDVLKKFLISQGYDVNHIMNLTDVGHLVSDADEGEDKMEVGKRKFGKDAWELAEHYIKVFKDNFKEFNILEPSKFLRATDTIQEQIDFVKELDEKGYLYKISDGMYFDTSKIDDYGILANLQNVDLEEGARVEKNKEKKSKYDFAVWKFSPEDSKRDMEWSSPWGKGFPGWHLECSVMSRMELGDTFDIHTGGEDHLTVHHPNEMAQSKAVTGKLQANHWLHNAFNKVDGKKMSKSSGSFVTLENIKEKGYSPLAYKLLVLQNNYRKSLNFTWESLESAQKGLINIVKEIAYYDNPKIGCAEFEKEFYEALGDDLNTSKALSVLQAVIDSDYPSEAKLETILKMDKILGLDLDNLRKKILNIPEEAKELLKQRQEARDNKEWEESDKLRDELEILGVEVKDSKQGQKAVLLKI